MSDATTRGRARSRFRLLALVATLGLLAACARFGLGFAELPASAGWTPLPIGGWVLNDGPAPRTIVYCPRESCARPGVAALIAVAGAEADRLEQALATDPSGLARRFAGEPVGKAGPKSTTTVEAWAGEARTGLLVTIRSADPAGRLAATAILHGRDGEALLLALGVSDEAETAKAVARAVWRSR